MPDDKPERLELGGTGYNNSTGNFELKATSRWGTATAGENANFEISATLEITDSNGNAVATVSGSSPVKKAGPADPGSGEVPLEDAIVAWDRNGGSFSGTVSVSTTASLTKNGNAVANSGTSRSDSGVVIGDSRTDPGPS